MIQRSVPRSVARPIAHAAQTSRNTSSASGLLYRNMSVATGVTARIAPATRPAGAPNQRRIVAYSTPTDATPSSACGASTDHELRPNSRTLRPISHSAAGGLSTVIAFAASKLPKNHAFQLVPAAWAAAE